MNKKIIIASFLSILFFSFLTLTAQAQSSASATINGLDQTANVVPAFKNQTTQTSFGSEFLAGYAGGIIGVILSFVGVLFLGLMIYAGLMWMTAQGNEQQVTKAKDLITNSVIGLIIVFAAYAITVFIGNNFLKQ